MIDLKQYEVWFVTGSQHLYGPKTLEKVAEHSNEIAAALECFTPHSCKGGIQTCADHTGSDPRIVPGSQSRPKLYRFDHLDAHLFPRQNVDCRVDLLKKPFVHLHTQYNREIPWAEIDMDFMNLNQSAHGDREFGFIGSRMRLDRKVVVGHWQDEDVQTSLGVWAAPPLPGLIGKEQKLPALATICAMWL